jgi:hypothetical protein
MYAVNLEFYVPLFTENFGTDMETAHSHRNLSWPAGFSAVYDAELGSGVGVGAQSHLARTRLGTNINNYHFLEVAQCV